MEKDLRKPTLNAAGSQADEPDESARIERALDKLVRELRCLYDIASITADAHTTLPEKLAEIVSRLPGALQYPDAGFAVISLGEERYKTANYTDAGTRLLSGIFAHGAETGTVEVGYTDEPPDASDGLFSKEEKLLLDAVAERLGEIIERNMAEAALKESEEKFSREFNASPDIMTITALDDGRIIEVNDKFAQASGFSRDEVIGH